MLTRYIRQDYYSLEESEILAEMMIGDVISEDKAIAISRAGYPTKIELRKATDKELAEALPGELALTREDIKRLRIWLALKPMGKDIELIALRYLVVPVKDPEADEAEKSVIPGDHLTTEKYDAEVLAELLASSRKNEKWEIRPTVRLRKKNE